MQTLTPIHEKNKRNMTYEVEYVPYECGFETKGRFKLLLVRHEAILCTLFVIFEDF